MHTLVLFEYRPYDLNSLSGFPETKAEPRSISDTYSGEAEYGQAIGEHKLDSRHVLRKEEARFLGNFDFDMRI